MSRNSKRLLGGILSFWRYTSGKKPAQNNPDGARASMNERVADTGKRSGYYISHAPSLFFPSLSCSPVAVISHLLGPAFIDTPVQVLDTGANLFPDGYTTTESFEVCARATLESSRLHEGDHIYVGGSTSCCVVPTAARRDEMR